MNAIVFRSEDGDYTQGYPTLPEMLAHLEVNTQIAICVIDETVIFGLYDGAYNNRMADYWCHLRLEGLWADYCGQFDTQAHRPTGSYAICRTAYGLFLNTRASVLTIPHIANVDTITWGAKWDGATCLSAIRASAYFAPDLRYLYDGLGLSQIVITHETPDFFGEIVQAGEGEVRLAWAGDEGKRFIAMCHNDIPKYQNMPHGDLVARFYIDPEAFDGVGVDLEYVQRNA